jgi:hypothetical protein
MPGSLHVIIATAFDLTPSHGKLCYVMLGPEITNLYNGMSDNGMFSVVS